ncbi:hypothetical protein DSO57_1031588 [Entomophthora muscae]|uniref:Uncharacterized protein n=1 Tax=Entomophthora muscae TaxID=34485 RepID=A0ACC2TM96_9FUNG|nr:hypothetical protein DSO57_1031588 [Entomophthora muscae]
MVQAEIKSTLPRRLRGSDPMNYSCSCSETGLVILFYGYFNLDGAQAFADQERSFLIQLGLTGKVRISEEGANVTVAGEQEAIEQYVSAWCHRFF